MNKAIICCLASMSLFVYGLRLLSFHGPPVEQLFSWSWLSFSILVICANSLELLYKSKNISDRSRSGEKAHESRVRMRN